MTTLRGEEPFRYRIFDDYFPLSLLSRVYEEFPAPQDHRWHRFANDKEMKLGGNQAMWGPYTKVLFDNGLTEPAFMARLQQEFDIGQPLSMDPTGGGYHLIPPGGYLDMHVDFNKQYEGGLWRRLNLIIFLNPYWSLADGGELYLGERREVAIEPVFNRMVVFETHDRSWHGHPIPTGSEFWRHSVAAYYFSLEPPPFLGGVHDTVFLNV